jgi:stage V sporulation protein B
MDSRKKNSNNFIIQGGILAIASLFSRVIGLLYRIPLTNIIGDEGNGIYASAYNVYNIILLLSSYSLPLAVSKMVSVRVGRRQRKNALRIYQGAMLFAVLVGLAACAITFFGAGYLTESLLKSPMSRLSLQVLAPAVFLVAVMGVLRGYFQGIGSTVPTAISQILEQIFNAVISVVAAYILYQQGEKVAALLRQPSYAAAYGAAGGTLGTSAGALAGLLFLLFVMQLYKPHIRKQCRKDRTKKVESWSSIYRTLFLTIVPVLLSTTIYNISSIIDQGIFNHVMALQGYTTKVYNSLYGIYSMKYKVLSNVPIALASAMAASSVPSVSSAFAAGDGDLVRSKIASAIRVTMVLSIPCAVGMGILASPILTMLLHDSTPLAANLLRIGSISILFYSLSTLTNGILQGIDRMRSPVIHAAIALVIHVLAFVLMILGFKWNIYAMVYADVLFAVIMCILNNLSIQKHIGYRQEFTKTFFVPLASAVFMGIVVWAAYQGIQLLTKSNTLATLVSICMGIAVYFASFLLLKGMNREELEGMPLGRTLAKIATKLRLLR